MDIEPPVYYVKYCPCVVLFCHLCTTGKQISFIFHAQSTLTLTVWMDLVGSF